MNEIQTLFLSALQAGLRQESGTWTQSLTPEAWTALFRLASAHHRQL